MVGYPLNFLIHATFLKYLSHVYLFARLILIMKIIAENEMLKNYLEMKIMWQTIVKRSMYLFVYGKHIVYIIPC